ncbi:MAG: hypothetical protein KH111_13535 [Bacteroidales bacterium]|nr:hypothetical protein [Bacteroidales bacterium]
MKTLIRSFSLLLALTLFFACSSDDEAVTNELKLSVPVMDEEHLITEDVDFEFDILEGNGGYIATVSEVGGEPNAKVTIEGDRVTVNLLDHLGADVTITDSKDQKATVYILSTNESLQTIPNYGLFLDEGQTGTMDIKFGAGAPYTIERIRGNASSAEMEGDKVKATSFGLGDTYYKIWDKRGSVTQLTVKTTLQFEMDMTSNYLEFDGVNNLSASIKLQWGTAWEVVGSTEKVTERVSVSRILISTGVWSDYYVLFINTVDKGKGTDTITLRNGAGDLAVVKVRIR